MRVNREMVVLVFACVAVILAAGTLHGSAMTLPTTPGSPQTFFPIDMFSGDMSSAFSPSDGGTTPVSSANTNMEHSFLTQALNMIPASDDQTKAQMSAIKSMDQNYDPEYTTVKTSPSWMSSFVQPTAIDGSSNPAQSAYVSFIKNEPNMTNIFAS